MDISGYYDLAKVQAANPHLGEIVSLSEFLDTADALTSAQRLTIVGQALTLIDDLYVHLPLKRAMHAVDPVQRLRLLKRRSNALSERQFHNELISIFKDLHDLHTNYILPAPYNQHTAFLPFLMEEYYEGEQRHYVVTKMLAGFEHPTLIPGVEVTHWSGVPVDQAVAISADREAGSNEAAQHVRGLDAMTVRPMSMSLPPDAEWIIVGYENNGNDLELRLPWRVFRPDTASGSGASAATVTEDEGKAALGYDLNLELTNQARKALFAPEVVERGEEIANLFARGDTAQSELEQFKAETSVFPDVFQFGVENTDHGSFGYLRIRTFSLNPSMFIPEVIRIIELLPQNGLIIDVRGNGGGVIMNGERMLQLFTSNQVEAERLHFINTDLTLAVARSDALGSFAERWERSIELALLTSAVYSQGFPIEPPEKTNEIGQRYEGPVVLITDGRCYSTTDIFAAGFQDNGLGKILGVDGNTGAGGANVFTHDLVQTVLAGPNSPIESLPNGSNMRVAIRRTTRVGENAGLPVEDLGVVPDARHRMTSDDVFFKNRDLKNAAAAILVQ